jgi:dTDP-glucose pyrophosphorylase
MIGLADTIWFPQTGFQSLPQKQLSFLLFPVENPQDFEAVVLDQQGKVQTIQVKDPLPTSSWIWGGIQMPGRILRSLYDLWKRRECKDECIGTLVNAYLEAGGEAWGVKAGCFFTDVGSLHGYREAIRLLKSQKEADGLPLALNLQS